MLVCSLNRYQVYRSFLPTITSYGGLSGVINVDYLDLCKLLKSPTIEHYTAFRIPKISRSSNAKPGSVRYREILAPSPLLKDTQRKLVEFLLKPLNQQIHPAVHGFRQGAMADGSPYSILSNAKPHCQSQVVINLDLKDFFTSIDYRCVVQFFQRVGYSPLIASALARLCCVTFADGHGYLPQGAPSSPPLTNLICHSLDEKLQALAQDAGFVYTRYADDLTFSYASDGNLKGRKELGDIVNSLIQGATDHIESENLHLNTSKIKVFWQGKCQEVTGIVVNQHPNISRKTLKQFRTVLHKLEQGEANVTWRTKPIDFQTLNGFATYVAMISPEKGNSLMNRVKRLRKNATV
jgi:RNA-directed DNA polymerase